MHSANVVVDKVYKGLSIYSGVSRELRCVARERVSLNLKWPIADCGINACCDECR